MVGDRNEIYDVAIIYSLEVSFVDFRAALLHWQSLVKRPTQIAITHLANGPHSYSLDFLASTWARPIH